MADSVTITTPRKCDMCDSVATVDGRTTLRGPNTPGPWANMCDTHWDAFGVGRLGTGFGHRLILAGAK